MKQADAQRFWAKVEKTQGGCWLWTGATNDVGYPQFYLDGRVQYAHRVSYELVKGQIATGLVIDHLCRTTRCVNPAHLDVVTVRENNLRGTGWSGRNSRKAYCVNGHELVGENVSFRPPSKRYPNGARRCLVCHRNEEADRRKRERNT